MYNSNKLIYLASPYSSLFWGTKEERFRATARLAALFLKAGHNVYSPICHSHPIATFGSMDGSWGSWQKLNETMMLVSHELWVVMLPGWEESVGVQAEINFFKNLNRPVKLAGKMEYGHAELLEFQHNENSFWWGTIALPEDKYPTEQTQSILDCSNNYI